ncbi:bifunctional epoxide hydrolase 2 [Acipenser oxyrinchus oxyrinchus]|uniref:Bifunctional epoxide hydrolase 2 n=1 Tax=Acipenser oxyrinchus oxyrinchus TaxID=40147 RepID=A0AAD8G9W7_ACIOX|nr:bifunctional epoxide hydrolase 2 [Acipenser oxyrinchus oxyrinchus]
MSARRVVLFDLGGVLMTPAPQLTFQKYEESLGIPRGFLQKTIVNGGPENPFFRAERGQITLSQFVPEFEAECKKSASSEGVTLPPQFSVQRLFEEVTAALKINKPMLEAAVRLRDSGFKTCVLTNTWVDDSAQREGTAQALSSLSGHFNLLIESCRAGMRKPEPAFYSLALDKLNAKPQEAIFLDDIGANLKVARELGMATILVGDTTEALKELQTLSGVQLLGCEEFMPSYCRPTDVAHGFVSIKPGVKIHYVEMGDGPPLCLCHGFPESWFSWRYQIPTLADAGFRVLALDMKGYGESTAPPDIEEYSQEEICKVRIDSDSICYGEKDGIPQVTLIGHDWGGSVVWNMTQCYPERVRAVASLNTPLFPAKPDVNPMERIKSVPIFDYQLYFQKPGVAEAEMEENLERTFKLMFVGSGDEDLKNPSLNTVGVCKRGGLFVGKLQDPPRSRILSESALQYYVQQYSKTGFRGPLNWYRNMEKNWRWACATPGGKIMVPALMVTAGKDPVLLPVFTTGMENLIPNLTRGHIEECGHWTQMERPAELNKILIQWLKDTHQEASIPIKTKL